jgi:hypothetical protein
MSLQYTQLCQLRLLLLLLHLLTQGQPSLPGPRLALKLCCLLVLSSGRGVQLLYSTAQETGHLAGRL